MKKLYFIFIFVIGNFPLFAQDSLFNYIIVSATSQESALLRFEMKSGNTCNGITIERSTDSISFNQIYFIAGVCGNSNVPVAYQFEDLSPVLNQNNFYRVIPGSGFPTRAVSVFMIDYNTDGYFLFPNPTENQVKVYFKNPNSDKATISLMNSVGQIISIDQVNAELWEPELKNLSAGVYFFSIDLNQQVISGQIIKN